MDLSHTIIATPIDGVVISRNVDVGQTVAASFQAPVLFLIANDLTRMQVNASIDEADVGRVREGQEVTFHVDAYPGARVHGHGGAGAAATRHRPERRHLQHDLAVDNQDLLLRPGMTATVSVIVRKAENALRLPAAALRFRPEGYERPSGRPRRRGRGAGQGATAQRGPGGGVATDDGRRGPAAGLARHGAAASGPQPASGAAAASGRRLAASGAGPAARPRSSSSTRPASRSRSRSASASPTASSSSCARASRRAPT